MDINLEASEIELSNDTVHLRSNVSLAELNVKMINNLVVDKFFDELFIINKNQKIRGTCMARSRSLLSTTAMTSFAF